MASSDLARAVAFLKRLFNRFKGIFQYIEETTSTSRNQVVRIRGYYVAEYRNIGI